MIEAKMTTRTKAMTTIDEGDDHADDGHDHDPRPPTTAATRMPGLTPATRRSGWG
jgi:hypothetical protein